MANNILPWTQTLDRTFKGAIDNRYRHATMSDAITYIKDIGSAYEGMPIYIMGTGKLYLVNKTEDGVIDFGTGEDIAVEALTTREDLNIYTDRIIVSINIQDGTITSNHNFPDNSYPTGNFSGSLDVTANEDTLIVTQRLNDGTDYWIRKATGVDNSGTVTYTWGAWEITTADNSSTPDPNSHTQNTDKGTTSNTFSNNYTQQGNLAQVFETGDFGVYWLLPGLVGFKGSVVAVMGGGEEVKIQYTIDGNNWINVEDGNTANILHNELNLKVFLDTLEDTVNKLDATQSTDKEIFFIEDKVHIGDFTAPIQVDSIDNLSYNFTDAVPYTLVHVWVVPTGPIILPTYGDKTGDETEGVVNHLQIQYMGLNDDATPKHICKVWINSDWSPL